MLPSPEINLGACELGPWRSGLSVAAAAGPAHGPARPANSCVCVRPCFLDRHETDKSQTTAIQQTTNSQQKHKKRSNPPKPALKQVSDYCLRLLRRFSIQSNPMRSAWHLRFRLNAQKPANAENTPSDSMPYALSDSMPNRLAKNTLFGRIIRGH